MEPTDGDSSAPPTPAIIRQRPLHRMRCFRELTLRDFGLCRLMACHLIHAGLATRHEIRRRQAPAGVARANGDQRALGSLLVEQHEQFEQDATQTLRVTYFTPGRDGYVQGRSNRVCPRDLDELRYCRDPHTPVTLVTGRIWPRVSAFEGTPMA